MKQRPFYRPRLEVQLLTGDLRLESPSQVWYLPQKLPGRGVPRVVPLGFSLSRNHHLG